MIKQKSKKLCLVHKGVTGYEMADQSAAVEAEEPGELVTALARWWTLEHRRCRS